MIGRLNSLPRYGYAGHTSAGALIINASWDTLGGARRNATLFPAFTGHIAAALNLPSIGRWPIDSGPWRCLPQDYHTADTVLVPVAGSVRIQVQ